MSTLDKVREIVAAETGLALQDLDPARPLEELGVDSLAVIEAMFRLEESFGIATPEDRVPIRNLQDIADLVDRLVAERDGGAK